MAKFTFEIQRVIRVEVLEMNAKNKRQALAKFRNKFGDGDFQRDIEVTIAENWNIEEDVYFCNGKRFNEQ